MAELVYTSSVATPGTIQRMTAGASPTLPTLSGVLSGTITPDGQQIVVSADGGNTAGKFVWVGGPNMNVASNVGWTLKIAPGTSQNLVLPGGSKLNAGDFWVDTDGTVSKYTVTVL